MHVFYFILLSIKNATSRFRGPILVKYILHTYNSKTNNKFIFHISKQNPRMKSYSVKSRPSSVSCVLVWACNEMVDVILQYLIPNFLDTQLSGGCGRYSQYFYPYYSANVLLETSPGIVQSMAVGIRYVVHNRQH